LKLLPTIFCVRFSQQSSISQRRFSSRWLHLVSIRCIATIGFSYHYSLRSASSDPKDQTIVCPKLRVSPLNAQTEFKVFSMQTIPSLQRLGTVCFMIVRSSVSYFFLAFLPSFIGLIVSPLPLQFRLGFLRRFAFATIWTHSALPVPTILPSKTGLYDICHHLNSPLRRSYSNSSRYRSDFLLVFVTQFTLP
jgi:hypothetical protein